MDKETLIKMAPPSPEEKRETPTEVTILRVLCIAATTAAALLVALTLAAFLWAPVGLGGGKNVAVLPLVLERATGCCSSAAGGYTHGGAASRLGGFPLQ